MGMCSFREQALIESNKQREAGAVMRAAERQEPKQDKAWDLRGTTSPH